MCNCVWEREHAASPVLQVGEGACVGVLGCVVVLGEVAQRSAESARKCMNGLTQCQALTSVSWS